MYNNKCIKVLVIAIFNLLVVYYVATSVSLEDEKKFVPKFQTRLPKDSQPLESNTKIFDPSENDEQKVPKISTNTDTKDDDDDENDDDDDAIGDDEDDLKAKIDDNQSDSKDRNENHLIDTMKNILFFQAEEDEIEDESEDGDEVDQTTKITLDPDLQRKLVDSEEIVLYKKRSQPIKTTLSNVQFLEKMSKTVVKNNLAEINMETPTINNMEDFRALMEARSKLLEEKCQDANHATILQSGYLYVLKSQSLVWCPVYKAASTNWMHNLLHLGGKSEQDVENIIKKYPNQPNDQARVVAPSLTWTQVRSVLADPSSTTLLIVRHPFDRLVSAFRDKLEQCHGDPKNCTLTSNWYYKQYGSKIVAQYRKEAIRKFGNDFFAEGNNFGAPYPVNRSWRDDHYPCFWEFVQYLLKTSSTSYDEHWKPASLYCGVCSESIEYENILHFENIETEESFFAKTLNAEKMIHPRWENNNSGGGVSKEEILTKYFDTLSDAEIMSLYKIYESDFRNFGYTFKFRNFSFG